jgi:hypothetical protein
MKRRYAGDGDTTLDANDHSICIFGVLCEVSIEKMERICVWSSVEVCPIPDIRTAIKRSLHDAEGSII